MPSYMNAPDFMRIRSDLAEVPAKFGVPMTEALGNLSKTLDVNKEKKIQAEKAENESRADEIESELQGQWNDPNSKIFSGITAESGKLRRTSELLLPWSRERANRYQQAAIAAKEKEEGRELESETKWNQGTLAREKQESDERIAMAKLGAPKDFSPADKEAVAKALAAAQQLGPEAYEKAKQEAVRVFGNVPAYSQDPSELIRWSQTITGGATSGAKSSADLQSAELGLTKEQLDIVGKRLGLTAQQLEQLKAQKNLDVQTGSVKGKETFSQLPTDVQPQVLRAKEEYQRRLAPLQTWLQQVDKLNSALPSSGPAESFNTIAAIVDFNKIIDPSSVVREAEFNVAQDAAGTWEGWKAKLGKFFSGNTLTDEGVRLLRQFAETNKRLIQSYIKRLDNLAAATAKTIGGGARASHIVDAFTDENSEAIYKMSQD